MAVTGYCLTRNIMKARIIRSIFWGTTFALSTAMWGNIYSNMSHFIDEIHLLQGGKKAEFVTANKKQITINIKMIRKAEKHELYMIG